MYQFLGTIIMSYTRYKKIKNNLYAYEITAYWDSELGQSRNKSKYLGRVDEVTKKPIYGLKTPKKDELLILDFGDGYFLHEFITQNSLFPIFQKHLFSKYPQLLALIIYRLSTGSAMYNFENWLEGNYLKCVFKDINLSSQRISDLLEELSDEALLRDFSLEYIKAIGGSERAIIIDATCMPSAINIDFNAWGHHGAGIDKQFKILCVVDQPTKLPIFYRFLPGNITDVSTLKATILELTKMGVTSSFAMLDARYFSQDNICDLYENKIDFLTRLPTSRVNFKNIVTNHIADLESLKYAHVIEGRTAFIKEQQITLFSHKVHAYVILDPDKKAQDLKSLTQKYCKNKDNRDEKKDKIALASCGIFILISSKHIKCEEVLSSYHLRGAVEQIFSFAKSDLNLLPIRHHNDKTVRGYLFLQFLLLILFIQIRAKISHKYTVEQALMILRKLKCKVFEDQIIPQELSRQQKEILRFYDILVPKKMGI
jgi:hypothetical protein